MFLEFRQSPWLAKYIDHNTRRRTRAKAIFLKDLFKILNNAFFDKTMKNIRNEINREVTSHTRIDQRRKRQSKLSFKGIVNGYSLFSVYKFDGKNSLR